jgi:glycosyltransferase involved in cell wall biosynthesis
VKYTCLESFPHTFPAYPGIDLEEYNPKVSLEKMRALRNEKGLPGEFILFLNTIEPRKNLENLIKSFETLNSSASLVIAGGSGWKNSNIINLIKKSKKRSKIFYYGYVEPKDKSALIKMSRCLVYPSFYEGFGFQPLEAFALGVPVLTSQVTALPEVVGDAALQINPYNINDIAGGLEMLLNNDNLREQLIKKGLERVKNFSWQKSAEIILNALQ